MRQVITFKKTVENGGNVTKAAKEAGYADTTINSPKNITETLGWDQLREKYLSEEKIAKVHSRLLECKRPVVVAGHVEMFPDNDVQKGAVDMGYKLRGRYAEEKSSVTFRKYGDLTDEELDLLLAQEEKKISKK